MDWRRLAGAWAIGVLCGVGLLYAGGSDYEIAPDLRPRDVEVAKSRGWELVLDTTCATGGRCPPMFWRRPKVLRFLGPPQYLEMLR